MYTLHGVTSRLQEQTHQADSRQCRQQRTNDMSNDDYRAPAVLLAQYQGYGLGGKCGKCGEAAAETGGHEQTQLRRQALKLAERTKRGADDKAAKQVSGERAERQRWQQRIERDAKDPAQQRTGEGAESDSENRCESHTISRSIVESGSRRIRANVAAREASWRCLHAPGFRVATQASSASRRLKEECHLLKYMLMVTHPWGGPSRRGDPV